MILIFALAKLVLHLMTSSGYGYFRDELYYLACTQHLDLGYVDHPALSILLLWGVRHTLGTSLLALRLLPALAGAATVALVGLIARRMGGGGLAQALAMSAALIAGEFLSLDHFYSMNAFDVLLWCLAAYVVVLLLTAREPRLWLLLGLVLGLGLANKIGVLWLAAGLAVGLLLTPERGWLASRWPWLGAGIAAALGAPYLLWQLRHGWPTLEFIHNATTEKMLPVSPGAFLHGQIDHMNPATLPLWLGGLAYLFFHPVGKRFRLLAWCFLVVFLILIANGASRAGYLSPAYTWLFAAGGVGAEALLARWRVRWAGWAAMALLLAFGAATAPFALPLLPVERYERWAAALGVKPQTEERKDLSELPQFYADMHGWREIVDTVARVYAALPAGARARARVLAPDYGVAGAVDFFGPARGLPPALSGHNSYWIWGPDGYDGGPLVVVGSSAERQAQRCTRFARAATIECGRCMPYENHRPVWVCESSRLPVAELWAAVKHYD
jgi:4-amino-4-deoxy-L-arabinose transferase-like glycosyltransferase